MKISVIGAGNVGGLTAMRLAQQGAGQISLIDVAPGLSKGKAFDMEDARFSLKRDYRISGSDDIKELKGSAIVVVTAGFARRPGMAREELLAKNAAVLKEVCAGIKKMAADAIVIIVTNPLDLMTRFALELTGFKPARLFGMGASLDAARFANIIAEELKVSVLDVEPCVIGSHGEGMLPIPRLTNIKGVSLDEMLDEKRSQELVRRTFLRGQEIVGLLGSGSAYFAPSAAIAELVVAVAKDQKRLIGVSAYLDGEYGLKDICIGVPCRIGSGGIEGVVELDLNSREKDSLAKAAANLKEQYRVIESFSE